MSKLTLTGNVSFETTFVIDSAIIEEAIKGLTEVAADERFKELPVKIQVFTKLVLEANAKEGVEGAAREILRLNVREGLNKLLRKEVAGSQEGMNVKLSPVKMTLGTAEKCLNAAKVRKAFAKADAELNTAYEA